MRSALKILLFASSFGLLLFLLDCFYTFGLKHNQNLKLTNTATVPPQADLLFQGACEPLWMISPELIDTYTGTRSYNLALSHSDFADNYLHLYMYLKHNSAPAHLFLFVTPECFDTRYNTFNTFRFAPYLGDSLVRKVVKENDPEYAKWVWIPFMRYAYYNRKTSFYAIQGWKHFFQQRTNAYYPDGFEPPAKRVWGNHAGEFVELYKEKTVFSIDSLRLKYFKKLIQLAKTAGIKVHLYESPVLRESLVSQLNRGEITKKIGGFAREAGVEYIQFDDLELSDHREYFISTLSLNMEGVRIFNDTLGKYLRDCCVK